MEHCETSGRTLSRSTRWTVLSSRGGVRLRRCVGELQTALDALQPFAYVIEALMDKGDIALLVREKPLHVRQVAFHRRDALADLAHFLPHGTDLATDRPQLLKDQILDFGIHGVSLAGIGVDTKGVDIDRASTTTGECGS